MKHSTITVEGTRYSVTHNEDATYTVTIDSKRSITILPKVGAYLTYKWHTLEGTESPLIEKIGFSIESQNFKKLVNVGSEPKNAASVLA
jgi:hypothetical protein